MSETKALVAQVNDEVNVQLKDPAVMRALVATTFKGLSETQVKQAIIEGMLRGFTFKDFLEKNVYAVPYGGGYSLLTSIDYSRKIAMRSGLAGKSAPIYKYESELGDDNLTCEITVKRNVDGVIGEYAAKVYFLEYYAGNKNPDGTVKINSYGKPVKPTLWDTKPRTMIAKVAEMHALRSAFPEEVSKHYVAEEMERQIAPKAIPELDITTAEKKLLECKNAKQLDDTYKTLTADERNNDKIKALTNTLKEKYGNKTSRTKDRGMEAPKKGKGNGDGAKKNSR